MTNPNAPGYAAANVLLDAVIAVEPGAPRITGPSVELALQRLSDIDGAYVVTAEDDPDGDLAVMVDLSQLLGGTLVALGRLVTLVSEASGDSREVVVADLRRWLATL